MQLDGMVGIVLFFRAISPTESVRTVNPAAPRKTNAEGKHSAGHGKARDVPDPMLATFAALRQKITIVLRFKDEGGVKLVIAFAFGLYGSCMGE